MNSNHKLALFGGSKAINREFRPYNSIGLEEINAAKGVVESGVLSQFLGAWHEDFYGGPKVLEFEAACRAYFGVKHAITVNSWTSGLISAVGAIGVEPGEEVIVSPWTMCASATAILHWNAIPVFVDIDPQTFCLDIDLIEANISPKTRAIMAVDIFGHSSDIHAINMVAKKHNLKVISDTAQAPSALVNGKYAGTLADIGGFSLNYHKHIHTGEGGILVTNDDILAERLHLIRNHAEAVVGPKGVKNISNMIGFNFRLGEIECAIGIEQLKKLKCIVGLQQNIALKLSLGLSSLKGLQIPVVKDGFTHAYYVYPLIIDTQLIGVSRNRIVEALESEGIPGLMQGYANLHLLPMYQQKIAYGSNGFPWNSPYCIRDISYSKGICPVAEQLHDETFLGFLMCLYDLGDKDIDDIILAFYKVWNCLDQLK